MQHPVDKKIILFDADGTLRRCTVEGQPCPNTSDEWALMPNVKETLELYDWYRVGSGIISNQGGVGLGYLEERVALDLLVDLFAAAFNYHPRQRQIMMCPHAPGDDCMCRKPRPYLICSAINNWRKSRFDVPYLHGRECLYVGDMESDLQAAELAGISFCWAKDFFNWTNGQAGYA